MSYHPSKRLLLLSTCPTACLSHRWIASAYWPSTTASGSSYPTTSSYCQYRLECRLSWTRLFSPSQDPTLVNFYLCFELIHRSEYEIPHKSFLQLRQYFHILDDGPIDPVHLIHYDLFELIEVLGLIIDLAGHMIRLQINGKLPYLSLNILILLTNPADSLVALIVDIVKHVFRFLVDRF